MKTHEYTTKPLIFPDPMTYYLNPIEWIRIDIHASGLFFALNPCLAPNGPIITDECESQYPILEFHFSKQSK